MIADAGRIAGSMRALISSRFHVEHDDLAGAAILGALQGQPMKYAVIDELRRLGGRGTRVDPTKHRRLFQIDEGYDRGASPKYIVGVALKRCGVLMLNCLHESRRRVIMLRYWHDLSQAETAAELGLTPGRIGQIEREACNTIAAELERRGINSLRDVV